MASTQQAERVAVITVHGTNDSAATLDGDKWWQRGSEFCQRLLSGLSQRGVDGDVVPFRWSGANNALEREKASERLAKAITQAAKSHSSVHVIGHSHGGNVSKDAAILLRWGAKRARQPIETLTTVGTPFLKARITPFQVWGAYFFLVIACLAALAWVGYAAISTTAFWHRRDLLLSDPAELRSAYVAGLLLLIAAVAISFMQREAFKGARRVYRLGRHAVTQSTVFNIWHPQDEAISILRAAETVAIEPFAPGSLLRGSRTGAILLAVRVVLAFEFLLFALLIASYVGFARPLQSLLAPLGVELGRPESYVEVAAIVGLSGGALLWSFLYLFYRFVFGVLADWFGRAPLNGALRNIFRGMAFGSVGDERVTGVSTSPEIFHAKQLELAGAVAERLATNAEVASTRLLEKYRSAVFNVQGDQRELFEQIPRDAMTWESLIHTTYFDAPEVATSIADHIAQSIRGASPPRV